MLGLSPRFWRSRIVLIAGASFSGVLLQLGGHVTALSNHDSICIPVPSGRFLSTKTVSSGYTNPRQAAQACTVLNAVIACPALIFGQQSKSAVGSTLNPLCSQMVRLCSSLCPAVVLSVLEGFRLFPIFTSHTLCLS